MRRLKLPWLQVSVHILALLPLVWLTWQFSQDQLTANPIREIQLRTGKYALNLLVLSLACSPIYTLFNFKSALQLRRPLGLYAFMYASLHFMNFIGLDYGFNFALIRADISDKRFAIVGFIAFLLLLLLAITSTKGWVERLGKSWKHLHRLIFVVAGLVVLHFLWQAKSKADLGEPLIYGAVIALLLIIRIPRISEAISRRSKRLKKEPDNHSIMEDI